MRLRHLLDDIFHSKNVPEDESTGNDNSKVDYSYSANSNDNNTEPLEYTICSNCCRRLDPADRYCQTCGAKCDESAQNIPKQDIMRHIPCMYGPLPDCYAEVYCKECKKRWSITRPAGSTGIIKTYCSNCGKAFEVKNFKKM